jgi:hypothetical protein
VNGYVEFHSPEGDPIVVNVDRVNFVRRFRGGNDASAVNFEKGSSTVTDQLPNRDELDQIEVRLVVDHTGISNARISNGHAAHPRCLQRSQAAQFFRRQAG